MANLVLKISTTSTAQNIRNLLSFGTKHLSSFLSKSGELQSPRCMVQLLNDDDVASSATLTMDFTNQAANDTIQIGNMTLTAKASGAAGAQFNIGGSNTASAVNLAAAINANSTLLQATSAAAIVTVKAASTGTLGNAIPIILVQVAAGITASGTALSGGLADTSVAISHRNF